MLNGQKILIIMDHYKQYNVACDGNSCVVFSCCMYDYINYNCYKGLTIFELNNSTKDLYKKAYNSLSIIATDYERTVIPKNQKSAKVGLVDATEENIEKMKNGSIFDENYDFYDFDAEKIMALVGYFLPTILWSNYINELNGKKSIRETVEGSLLDIKANKVKHLDIIKYGLYPDELVEDEALINSLDNLEKDSEWKSYGYNYFYDPIEYMQYIDIDFEGYKYRGVRIFKYRPRSEGSDKEGHLIGSADVAHIQKYAGYKVNKIYWFKYMPIEWYIVETGKNYKLVSTKVLDCGCMCNNKKITDGPFCIKFDSGFDFVKHSNILPFLKKDFLESAIGLKVQDICILSSAEYKKLLSSKISRKPIPTQYSIIKGYLNNFKFSSDEQPFVWTSTFRKDYDQMAVVLFDGTIQLKKLGNVGFVTKNYGGIQPSIVITNETFDKIKK